MFDIGWTELLLIGIVALIVVGPKDLPVMFHTLGRFTAKARAMAREFTRAMDDAAKESGVGDIAKDLKNMTSARKLGLDKVQEAATQVREMGPDEAVNHGQGDRRQRALTEERAATAEKVREASAKRASDRIAAEASCQRPPPKRQNPTPRHAEAESGGKAESHRKAEGGQPGRRLQPAPKPAAKPKDKTCR